MVAVGEPSVQSLDEDSDSVTVPKGQIACGTRDEAGIDEAGSSSWPWQAAVHRITRGRKIFICGGALIRMEWVLTAAHRFAGAGSPRDPGEVRVRLGSQRFRNDSAEDEFVQIREVSQIVLHEELNRQNEDADVALLKLKEPSVSTDRVRPICLPTRDHLYDLKNSHEMQAWVAGLAFKTADPDTIFLTEAKLPISSNPDCRELMNSFDWNRGSTLTSNLFCSGHDEDPLPEGTAGTHICRLGGLDSRIDIVDHHVSSTFYYDDALVPEGYVFATATTGKFHFLRKPNGSFAFADASDACEADGRGRMVADDRDRNWHDRIVSYMGSEHTWLGADDRDEDGVFTWVHGDVVSNSLPHWCEAEPDFSEREGQTERCLEMVVRWGFDAADSGLAFLTEAKLAVLSNANRLFMNESD
ncbi:unnamed protein product [Darwinula stevensoni]|uniref:Peptidase S1 domain-containing protein n=1 Tax=Darwinula stevensoni TaxID=69355 RepID=A0A7R9A591_9CRUS|nr:unnamed protein product [Darwinula stevensoni]CAG0885930.1 unnamed protein product [Darwinula stevensoni]